LTSGSEGTVDIEEHNGVLDRTVGEQRNDTGGDGGHVVVMLGDLT
jgi:hypothetical protein